MAPRTSFCLPLTPDGTYVLVGGSTARLFPGDGSGRVPGSPEPSPCRVGVVLPSNPNPGPICRRLAESARSPARSCRSYDRRCGPQEVPEAITALERHAARSGESPSRVAPQEQRQGVIRPVLKRARPEPSSHGAFLEWRTTRGRTGAAGRARPESGPRSCERRKRAAWLGKGPVAATRPL